MLEVNNFISFSHPNETIISIEISRTSRTRTETASKVERSEIAKATVASFSH